MRKDEFTKLFLYLQEMEQRIEKRFEAVDARFDRIDQRFDDHAKQILDNQMEIAAHMYKLDRHEKWIHVLAEKAKLRLEYQ